MNIQKFPDKWIITLKKTTINNFDVRDLVVTGWRLAIENKAITRVTTEIEESAVPEGKSKIVNTIYFKDDIDDDG